VFNARHNERIRRAVAGGHQKEKNARRLCALIRLRAGAVPGDSVSGLRSAFLWVSWISGTAPAGDNLFRVFFGAFVGIVQDSLSQQLIGMYGIVKTLVGYFAASVSMRFDVENPVLIGILSFFFYFFHQFFYWVLDRALLGHMTVFDPQQTFVYGLLNAAVALPLFHLLDKLKARA
jgi:rod shape-determining protein MreD